MPAANSPPNSAYIALLRGINVGGHNKIPMAGLRELCTKLGFGDVQTYIQSGNVVFTARKNACAVEALLESAILKHFSLAISVLVRNASIWPDYVAGNPFPEIANDSPGLLILCLSKLSPKLDAVAALRERATDGERIERVGDTIWLHCPNGFGQSKLSPTFLDRVVGSPVTARNWRTVVKLFEMTNCAKH